jgi:hypothetical protein
VKHRAPRRLHLSPHAHFHRRPPMITDRPLHHLHVLRTNAEPVTNHSSTPTDGWSGLAPVCQLPQDPPPWSAPDVESLSFLLPQMESPIDGVPLAAALHCTSPLAARIGRWHYALATPLFLWPPAERPTGPKTLARPAWLPLWDEPNYIVAFDIFSSDLFK